MKPLTNKVAVVAGATRGAGRGIACMLGEAGAAVYCTGRSTRARLASRQSGNRAPFALEGRPETIEETAEMVSGYGGVGIPVQVDHTDEEQVKDLFARVQAEQGKLDLDQYSDLIINIKNCIGGNFSPRFESTSS